MEIKYDKRNYRKHNDKNKELINKSEIKEIWKPIKDFEGSYEISNLGNVKSLGRYCYCKSKEKPNLFKGKILKQRFDKYGYLIVNLKKNQKSHIRKVHRLVAIAYIDNKNNYTNINHKDGIKTNNNVNNLEWCTVKENTQHRTRTLLTKPKLTKEQVLDIIKNCKPAKNQINKDKSITHFANKYNVDRRTISDIINRKKLYLGALCK